MTGASTGIGLAIVRHLLATSDDRVVATARAESLPRFAAAGIVDGERVRVRPLDLTVFEDHTRVVDEVTRDWGGVDVLVNNAGIAYSAVTEHMNPDDEQTIFCINYFAPMNLVRLVLPGMRERRDGRIINVSSVSGMMAMPAMGAYSASKFALEGASESLWYEARPWGIKVSLIQPGFVHSMSFRNTFTTPASRASMQDENADYHAYYGNLRPFVERMMNRSLATPERVATTIVRTMNQRSPKLRVPATPDAWLFYYLRRALPRRLYHFILYRNLPDVDTWAR